MNKFLIMFAVSFIAVNLSYVAFSVVGSLNRIADALEDLAYKEEEDEKESEVKNAQE